MENKRNPIESLQKLNSTNRIPTRHSMEIVQNSCIIIQKSYILQAEIWKSSWNPNESLKGPQAIRCTSYRIVWQTQRNSPLILKYQWDILQESHQNPQECLWKSHRILETNTFKRNQVESFGHPMASYRHSAQSLQQCHRIHGKSYGHPLEISKFPQDILSKITQKTKEIQQNPYRNFTVLIGFLQDILWRQSRNLLESYRNLISYKLKFENHRGIPTKAGKVHRQSDANPIEWIGKLRENSPQILKYRWDSLQESRLVAKSLKARKVSQTTCSRKVRTKQK